ncbi:unnamed protein product [Durusdinium trenchii]|uniref:Uncharacterized protein n=1 Tax=Durusdinium trenchii TaxID=1381693 RepID=A0ABP0MQP5_9DINO
MAVRLLEELAGKVAESQGDRMGVLQGALPAWLEYAQSLDDAQAVEGYLETAPHGLQHAESDAVRSAVIRKLKSAHACGVLADVLYARMGLRAPTEATYAMCVAVLAHTHGHLRDTTFQLGTLLQTMKQAWRAHFRRHDVKGEDECLLELLPKESSQIPLAAKERLNLEALTPEDQMPVSWAQLTAFAPRVRLRQSRQDRTGSLQEVAVQSLRDLPGPPAASHREAAGKVPVIHAEPSVAGDGQCAVVPLLPGPSLEVQETQTETPPPVEDEVKAGGQFLQQAEALLRARAQKHTATEDQAQKSVAGAQASDGDQAKPGNITFEAKGPLQG